MIDQDTLTPQKIVRELDKYIIGQESAKKHVAIALRNRWRRMHAPENMRKEIVPNNILMIGKTGVGKTEVARRLARIANAPFVKVEASKFTEVGYVGRDVEGMVRDLTEQAFTMVREENKKNVDEKAKNLVEEMLLDILVPPSENETEKELEQKARERFRKKLQDGTFEEKKVEISIEQQNSNMNVIGGSIDEISMNNIQEMMSSMMPKQVRKRKVKISEARRILYDQEVNKLIDMDTVREKSVRRVEEVGIIFIDEIDKIAATGARQGPDVSREGVQRDLLPIVEGSAINTKHGIVHSDHILFIAAGAFHVSKPSDLIPELQGRFPIRVELENLTEENFYQILKTPQNALIKQYVALFKTENVLLEFKDDAIRKIAEVAYQANLEVENIGARRLHTVMSYLLNDFLFDMPDTLKSDSTVEVTIELVNDKLKDLVKNKDLNQYIL